MSQQAATDNALLSFGVKTRTVRYGDKRSFIEYQIEMRRGGKVVGIEFGPSRSTITRADALKAARQRIRELKSHRLFIIEVTKKHIKDGEGRNCHTCPIAQALWHNQERMGFPTYDYDFEVSTYACFAEPRGIVLVAQYSDDDSKALPANSLPVLVMPSKRSKTGYFTEEMVYWTMHFDDWDDSQHMSIKEWREVRGYEDGERPFKPSPCTFVFDVDALQVSSAEVV